MKLDTIHILAVEDNPADFRLLQEYLKEVPSADFKITQAKTLKEALSYSASGEFNIILLDLDLPDSRGIETIEKVYKKNPQIPIVVLTGVAEEEMAMRALEKNAQDYLIKSKIEPVLLIRSIRYAIERNRFELELRKKSEDQQIILNSVPAMVFYKDKDNHFIRTNKTFEDVMGMSKEALEGKSLFDIYPAQQAQAYWDADLEIIKTKKAKHGIIEPMETLKGARFLQTDKIPYFDEQGSVSGIIGFSVDITERKKAEEELHSLNRILRAQSHSDQAMMRSTDEQAYLNEVCSIIIKDCGYAMVWIGFAQNDDAKTVRPVAQAGFEAEYLKRINISWADNELGRGPTGTAIRTGKPSLCRNMLVDPKFKPWREEALKRGYASSIVLPLIADSSILGAISIYSKKPDPFSEEEVNLLVKLADDLAYGITAIRLRILHKKSEDNLRQTSDYLENLINYANAPIICWDRNFNISRFNHAFERLTDYKAEEVIGKKLEILFSKATSKELFAKIKATLSGEYWEGVEIPILRKDGEVRTVLWSSANIYANNGKALLATIAQGQDITERKIAEAALQRAHDELEIKVNYRTQELIMANKRLIAEISKRKETEGHIKARNIMLKLLNQAPSRKEYAIGAVKLLRAWSNCRCVGIRLLDEYLKIPYESYTGFSKHFWKSENWLCLNTDQCACIRVIKGISEDADKPFMTKEGAFYCNDTTKLLRNNPKGSENKFRGVCIKSGFRSLAVIPIRHQDKILGAIQLADKQADKLKPSTRQLIEAIAVLIGEAVYKFTLSEKLKTTQNELEQSRRLSDIGTLAATVAHELRNPLAAIGMASFNIRRKAKNPDLDKHLANIEKKIYESDQIINNLLYYSRIKPPHYELVDICDIVKECAAEKKKQFKNMISISVMIKALKDALIGADPLQIREVFSNIIDNACDAVVARKGRIKITIIEEGSYIKVSIADNGQGIEKECLSRVFDPFFTTKAKGTGLGLSVCSQIITMHKGLIEIQSQSEKGTVVTISLPKGINDSKKNSYN